MRRKSRALLPASRSDLVDCVWNVMAHAQKPDFVFRRNGRVHFNQQGRQLSRLLAAEVCASAVVMLDTTCSEVVWKVLAKHSIRQFPLRFPSRASPCAITFQLDCTPSCYETVSMLRKPLVSLYTNVWGWWYKGGFNGGRSQRNSHLYFKPLSLFILSTKMPSICVFSMTTLRNVTWYYNIPWCTVNSKCSRI